MTPEKITAASGMATVSTSSEVFMGQIQSIIDSKNKEATNKFASQGAKPKSKSFVLPPPLRDSYNNDRAALPITMNSGVNTTASIVSSSAPHPTSVMPPMSQVAGVPYSALYTPCNGMPSSWGAMQNFTPVPYPMQMMPCGMNPGWNMWGQFPPQYGMMSSSVPGPQVGYIPPVVPTSSMIGQGAVPSMLTGGCIPPVTQIKSEPCNVIGTSQASNVTTSLDVQGASNFIPSTQQQWQLFHQQQLQQQPHLVQQLQQNQQRVPQPQHAPLPQHVPQLQHAPLPQQVPPPQQAPLAQQVPPLQPLVPPQQLPPHVPMRQVNNIPDRIDTLPKSLRYDGSDSWKDFQQKFMRFAEVKNWRPQESKDYLGWCLEGRASEYFATVVTQNADIGFLQLMQKLEKRFGYKKIPETAQLKMNSLMQANGESLEDWADRVFQLALRAYEGLPEEHMLKQAIKRICHGCMEKEAGQYAINQHPYTI